MNHNFLTQIEFSTIVENRVKKNKLSYMDTILELCEEHEIEINKVPKLLSVKIKSKLKDEAMDLNFYPNQKETSLPV